jgi:phospholipid/cholesterol/gamma-HCH transport system substrate-binding protein
VSRTIRKHARELVALLVLGALSMGVTAYVLVHQRLHFPLVQAAPAKFYADFSTAQAVTPGQGQTVRVSGVRVGDIGTVQLRDGHARIEMDLDRKYRHIMHADAVALLRPKTGLKDMFIELTPGSPGSPRVEPGYVIPLSRTEPDVNPDEILAVLDADTRDYLVQLINGAGRGLRRNGDALAEVFRRFEPTHRDLARVAGTLARRRHQLARLVHSLRLLNETLAVRKTDLTSLVDASSAVFRAFAAEDANVSRAVRDLPAALTAATSSLGSVQRLADVLGPAATRLLPAVERIPAANAAVSELARTTLRPLRDEIRPFVVAARPVVRELRPASTQLAQATPNLTSALTVVNRLLNMAAYNPRGREAASVPGRQEGFLFWLAWTGHAGRSLFSSQDANGGYRPLLLTATCQTYRSLVKVQGDIAVTLLNLTPFLDNPAVCPPAGSP